ncbi:MULTISPECIES: flagellar type III secretion system protein FlhB [unclassified Sphingomonas]|uniref:flagellar type III secretion system protein FlhB n=1 Tax=unclassified Sphingomonas TaxID=196159 RepID=UPI0006FD9064|nr:MULTISPECIES: flagellar type III secretion system protein FlhB [unclassified Sphingomonas]KQX20113.1 flagellar biosynthesis protein FlhB [Sphingomonas sp. Root1294]KQY67363.1 flagellar biosynthesis protein FlhB [Sphingomonas sp. Root50]KRB90741.1 flagellar biosynthesis protein FlhB [Sphingomonas sp. Root720]
MAEGPEDDEKTEAPTPKRRQEASEKGDVLQSKELGTALVMIVGAGWIAVAGPWLMAALKRMLSNALSFDAGAIEHFDPLAAFLATVVTVAMPLVLLFALTFAAAIAAPAMLGSLGFRWSAIAFKGNKLNPMAGLKRIFGMQGLIELGKSLLKILAMGAVGYWLLMDQIASIVTMGQQDLRTALDHLGSTFVFAVMVMTLALAVVAGADVPMQIFQRGKRLRMSKQEIKEESKQTEGSPELKAAIRQKQMAAAMGSARKAVVDATLVLTNPTHFAVALRYRPGFDVAPVVLARGRGATAQAIRELATENDVPLLQYPQLTRAIYYTSRSGQVIREDLFIAVAAILAFVFNLDRAMAEGIVQPDVDVPMGARFDEEGRKVG